MRYFIFILSLGIFISCTHKHPITGWEIYNLKGKVKVVTQLEYAAKQDSNGTIRKGRLRTKRVDKYDEKGNQIETACYDSMGKVEFDYINHYDSNNHKIRETGIEAVWNSKNPLKIDSMIQIDEKCQNTVDDKNRTVKVTYNRINKPGITRYYIYDDNNRVVKVIDYNNVNKLLDSFRYINSDKGITSFFWDIKVGIKSRFDDCYTSFDSQNNWISCINYLENEPIFITERNIIYYQ